MHSRHPWIALVLGLVFVGYVLLLENYKGSKAQRVWLFVLLMVTPIVELATQPFDSSLTAVWWLTIGVAVAAIVLTITNQIKPD